jgi:hypothetical protein
MLSSVSIVLTRNAFRHGLSYLGAEIVAAKSKGFIEDSADDDFPKACTGSASSGLKCSPNSITCSGP